MKGDETGEGQFESAQLFHVVQIGMGWFPEQPGGLDRYYMDLLKALPTAGAVATGLVVGSTKVEENSGGRVRAVSPAEASLPARMRAMRSAFDSALRQPSFAGPHLVAAHFALYAFPLLRKLRQHPFVSHFHGPWAKESRREGGGRLGYQAKHAVERAVYRRAQRCICLSAAFAREMVVGFGVDESRIRIIPGGVDVDRFRSSATKIESRRLLGWPLDRPIVFCVRRLVRRMGLESLIDAVASVRRSVPDVVVIIAGKGPLMIELQTRITAGGLAEHVRLIGFAADDLLPNMYRAADVSIVPTEALEGFGLTTVESLAAGTPVLVTPVGGLPEVVGDLSEGLILDGTGPAAIADGLVRALAGILPLPDTKKCSEYAAARFDWSVVARRVYAVYREAIEVFGV